MDLEKAFDIVPSSMTMTTVRLKGTIDVQARSGEAIYKNTKGEVVVGSETQDELIGLKQSSAVSPLLFV